MPIAIGDNDNRFAAMRPVFQRCCPGTSERVKTVIDRDGLVYLVGFVVYTTSRYAHLARDSIKASSARVADSICADILDREPREAAASV